MKRDEVFLKSESDKREDLMITRPEDAVRRIRSSTFPRTRQIVNPASNDAHLWSGSGTDTKIRTSPGMVEPEEIPAGGAVNGWRALDDVGDIKVLQATVGDATM